MREVEIDDWLLGNIEGSLNHQLSRQGGNLVPKLTRIATTVFGPRRGMDIDHAISDTLDTHLQYMRVRLDSIFNFQFNTFESTSALVYHQVACTLDRELIYRWNTNCDDTIREWCRQFHLLVINHFQRED